MHVLRMQTNSFQLLFHTIKHFYYTLQLSLSLLASQAILSSSKDTWWLPHAMLVPPHHQKPFMRGVLDDGRLAPLCKSHQLHATVNHGHILTNIPGGSFLGNLGRHRSSFLFVSYSCMLNSGQLQITIQAQIRFMYKAKKHLCCSLEWTHMPYIKHT